MKTPHELIVTLHFLAGAMALAAFWLPALSRKGGTLHRRAGTVYVWAMWIIVATALPLSLRALLLGQWVIGSFLGYLVVITATALYLGIRALRTRRQQPAYLDGRYRLLAWLNLASGALILGLGLLHQVWLLAGFSLIGLLSGIDMLRTLRTPPSDPRYWLREHLGGMIGTGMAAHVAFLNFGAMRLIPGFDLGGWGMLAWFVPVALGTAAIIWASGHYAPAGKRDKRATA